MQKLFSNCEEIIADERFLNWYFQADRNKSNEWEALVAAHPDLAGLVTEATEWMKHLPSEKEPHPQKITESVQRLMSSLGEPDGRAPVIPIRHNKRRLWWVAAAVVLMLAAGTAIWKGVIYKPSVQTKYGQMLEQQLPDGTQVTLNAHTKLTYSEGWENGAEREVWLKGEAFFHVKKTASHSRFIVHTSQLDIIVTGTQFNVESNEDHTNVMLTEGSVIIHTKNGQEINMKPGDFVAFNHQMLEKKAVPEENVLAWRDKKLVFDNTPLTKAIEKIEDHYGVTITLTDSTIGSRTITGIMPNDNLDVLLKSVEAAMDLKVTRQDDLITIDNQ